ncbi:drd-1 [Pristionchus pacificus]|uniref:Drd-1 n=1 Tax=Pristionchus pacificus TaxID=54126 RepID=A0A454XU23_PRIPA|nr:drd-1 [Pristionchus pacificus]|eukprot:PDM75432.1 drd-1 [Pristionchus pacificus]
MLTWMLLSSTMYISVLLSPLLLWDRVATAAKGDDFLILYVGSIIWGVFSYVVANVPFVYLDFADPEWVQPYRIQDGDSKKVTFDRWLRALRLIAFNVLVIGPMGGYLMYRSGRIDLSLSLPSVFDLSLYDIISLAIQFLGIVLVEEAGFYYSHRLDFGLRFLIVHSTIRASTSTSTRFTMSGPHPSNDLISAAITSVYAHPLEHAFSNVLPVMAGPMLMGSHVVLAWTWFTMALFTTTVSHSGYHLPFHPSAEAHDHHHVAFTECFGVLGILDYLHGTNKTFLDGVKFKRHRTYYTTEPIKVTYPDIKKD